MVEVFRTNVQTKSEAIRVSKLLKDSFGYKRVNFDLEDCDKILRIEAPRVVPHCVIGVLKTENFECEILLD